jgi:hypothetical protein
MHALLGYYLTGCHLKLESEFNEWSRDKKSVLVKQSGCTRPDYESHQKDKTRER